MRWYAAKTKAGQDQVALDNLQRQNFQTYYPRVLINRRDDSEPLFPGYVLIRLFLDVPGWRVINNTRGVSRLLSLAEDGAPSPLPDAEIVALQSRESAGDLRIAEARPLSKGDLVRVAVGPSVDMIGTVIRTRGERVELLMRLLGRNVRCIAPEHALGMVSGQRRAPVR